MAQSSNAVPFESGDEGLEEINTLDNTCPDCGTESIVSYIDRHSSYEYCTNCDWSDEDDGVPFKEQIGRGDRRYQEDQ